jgi:hypothetical protein
VDSMIMAFLGLQMQTRWALHDHKTEKLHTQASPKTTSKQGSSKQICLVISFCYLGVSLSSIYCLRFSGERPSGVEVEYCVCSQIYIYIKENTKEARSVKKTGRVDLKPAMTVGLNENIRHKKTGRV